MEEVLRSIAQTVVRRLEGVGKKPHPTAFWTTTVIDALRESKDAITAMAGLKDGDVRVFHHNRDAKEKGLGEYLLDCCMTTWPVQFKWEKGQEWPKVPYELLLAAESEWGSEAQPALNYSRVMDDFCKLVDVKARVKVMVYGGHLDRSPTVSDLVEGFERILRLHAGFDRREGYVFIAFPWDSWKPVTHIARIDPERGVVLARL